MKKSIDGVLETRTQECRKVGADEYTELWRLPHTLIFSVWQSRRKLKKYSIKYPQKVLLVTALNPLYSNP